MRPAPGRVAVVIAIWPQRGHASSATPEIGSERVRSRARPVGFNCNRPTTTTLHCTASLSRYPSEILQPRQQQQPQPVASTTPTRHGRRQGLVSRYCISRRGRGCPYVIRRGDPDNACQRTPPRATHGHGTALGGCQPPNPHLLASAPAGRSFRAPPPWAPLLTPAALETTSRLSAMAWLLRHQHHTKLSPNPVSGVTLV